MWKIEYTSRANPRNGGFLPAHPWPQLSREFSSIADALAAARAAEYNGYHPPCPASNVFNFRARNVNTSHTVYLIYQGETDAEALLQIDLENIISTPTEETMPSQPTQPAQTDLFNPLPTHEPAPLVSVNITRHKPTHRLILQINAKPLHDLLDAIGVPHDHGVYTERPSSSIRIASGNTLSTEIFLKREYPVTIDLSTVLTAPVAHSRLEELANSSQAAVAKILEFYQPVDIQISVVPKAVKDK